MTSFSEWKYCYEVIENYVQSPSMMMLSHPDFELWFIADIKPIGDKNRLTVDLLILAGFTVIQQQVWIGWMKFT